MSAASIPGFPVEAEVVAPSPAATPTRVRLEYLDGIRGLAALLVAVFHAGLIIPQGGAHGSWFEPWLSWLWLGRGSVAVFIVLSGYCLMLPVVRSVERKLEGGFRAYLARRAWRILPAYLAALILSVAVLAALSRARTHEQGWLSTMYPVLDAGVILSHALLVHNLHADWCFKINSPMWSVAVEWQIYFLFPLLLIPIWRRFGSIAAVVASYVAGIVPIYFVNGLSLSAPWLTGLFAMGMAAATLGAPNRPRRIRSRDDVGWGWFAGFVFAGWAYAGGNGYGYSDSGVGPLVGWKLGAIVDSAVGVGTFALLVHCTESLTDPQPRRVRSWAVALFESKPAKWLGRFSYSLYLTHALVLVSIEALIMRREALSRPQAVMVSFGLGIPLALIVGYGFYLAFERPFLRRRTNTRLNMTSAGT